MTEERPRPSVRIVVPEGSTAEAELQRLARRWGETATAFQGSPAIQGIASKLASTEWPSVAKLVGFGSTLSGAEGVRAVSALASHQVAATTLSGKAWRVGSLLPIVANMEGTIVGLTRVPGTISAFLDSAPKLLLSLRSLFEGWEDTLHELGERQQDLDANTAEFVRRHGWPVPMCLPYRTYGRIVGLAGHPKREVSRAMTDFYRPGSKAFRSCARVLLDWPALEDRRPIVRQALRAHRRGEHYLVINALLPMIEGVLVDAVFTPETVPDKARSQKALAALRAEDEQDSVLRAVEMLVVSGATGMGLLASSHPRDVTQPDHRPRRLNRHAILHGYARSYGSQANALRMILLLTVLVEVIEQHGRRYPP